MKRRCPYCNSRDVVKAGRNASGTQRYKCKCGRTYTAAARGKALADRRRLAAALLTRAGYSLRDAAKILSVSQQTVKNCAEEYAHEITVTFGDAIYDIPAFTHLADTTEEHDDEF